MSFKVINLALDHKTITFREFRGSSACSLLGPGVRHIADEGLMNCRSLFWINAPKLTSLGYRALFNTPIDKLRMNRKATYIGPSALAFSSLKQFHVPNTVYEIGEAACFGCKQMTEAILPLNLLIMARKLFCMCTALTTVVLSMKLHTIDEHALDSTAIKQLIIPNTVRNVNYMALANTPLYQLFIESTDINLASFSVAFCENLQRLVLPDTPIAIAPGAFFRCRMLEDFLEEEGYGDASEYVHPGEDYDLDEPLSDDVLGY
jgi:hypothetical protein